MEIEAPLTEDTAQATVVNRQIRWYSAVITMKIKVVCS